MCLCSYPIGHERFQVTLLPALFYVWRANICTFARFACEMHDFHATSLSHPVFVWHADECALLLTIWDLRDLTSRCCRSLPVHGVPVHGPLLVPHVICTIHLPHSLGSLSVHSLPMSAPFYLPCATCGTLISAASDPFLCMSGQYMRL